MYDSETDAVTQVVFIDPRTPDIQDLLDGLQPGVIAHVLDPDQDGLTQIADFLSANHLTGLTAIDIVGHGASGEIGLGSTTVDDAALGSHAAALSAIGSSLASGGDIALYSCDTAQGTAGQTFIADLSSYTGAGVEASTHLVGAASGGGSFVLDAHAGAVGAEGVSPFTQTAIESFQGELNPAPTKAEVVVVGTGGGANDTLIFADDNGTGASPHQTTFFSPGSNVPATVDNNVEFVVTDPLNNRYFLVVSNTGEHKILEGTLDPDLNTPGSSHTLTTVYSDTNTGQITGIAVDPTTQTIYFTEGKNFEQVGYGGGGATVDATSTTGFLNGFTLDLKDHTAYFISTSSKVTTNTAGTAITTVITNALYKDSDISTPGTKLSQLTLATGAGGPAGEISAIAITPDDTQLVLTTTSASKSDSGVYEYNLSGNAGGTVSTLWSQNAGGPAGDIKGVAVDALGNYYVTVADGGADGVYEGNLTSLNTAPTLFLSMPAGGTGLEPAGLTADVAPTLTAVSGTSTHAVQGGAALTILTGAPTAGDLDATGGDLAFATVTITDAQAGDILAATTAGTAINASYNSTTHVLTLSGADTFAHYQQVLASVTYQDTGSDTTTVGKNPVRHVDITVDDGMIESQTSEVVLTINRPPTVKAETGAVLETATVNGTAGSGGTGALAGDTDLDGTGLSISAISGGTVGSPEAGKYGALTLNADGSYTYAATNTAAIDAAAAGSHPTDSFTYTVTNGEGLSANSTITFTIDRPPTVVNEQASVVESATASGTAGTGGTGALAGDSDKDGDGLSISGVSNTTSGTGTLGVALAGVYGSLTQNKDGSYSYVASNTGAIDAAATGSHVSDVFTVAVSDGQGGTSNATLTFDIDRAPTAANDTNSAVQGGAAATGNVLTNDSDPDGDTLTVSALTGGTVGAVLHGTYGDLTLNADGTYSYSAGATGTQQTNLAGAATGSEPVDSFTYTASDGHGGTSTAQLKITVDRLPTLTADSNTALQGGSAVNGNVLTNDSDLDGQTLTVSGFSDTNGAGTLGSALHGNYGDLVLNADGTYTYTPGATPGEQSALAAAPTGSHATDTFSYTASDGVGGSSSSTLTITLDRLPTTSGVTTTVVEGATDSVAAGSGLLTADSDPDGDSLVVTAVAGGTVGKAVTGTYGDFTVSADGAYTYVANNTAAIDAAPTGSRPSEQFTVTVSDGHGGTATQTVTVTVDRPPVATDDSYTAFKNTTLTENAASGVLANDSDPDHDTLTAVLQSGPAHAASFALNPDGSFSYTPANNYLGGDSFTYQATDGTGNSVTKTVSITVENLNPTPTPDTANVVAGHTVSATSPGVLGNDTDPNNSTLSVSGVSDTAHGAGTVGAALAGLYGDLTLNADGSYSYVAGNNPTEISNLAGAANGSHATDVFTYTVSNTLGGSANSTLTITLDRLPVTAADTDTAVQAGAAAAGNVLTNDSDPDGDSLTVSAVTGGTVGTLFHGTYGDITLNADGSYTYAAGATPTELSNLASAATGSHPTETITYTASDGQGGTTTNTLTITVDRLPTVTSDSNTAVQGGAAATGNVLTNDSDKDGDTLTVSALTGGTVGTVLHGTYGDLTLNADGSYSYSAGATPTEQSNLAAAAAGAHPTESFTYTASDGKGGTASSTLTFTVDRPPVSAADTNTAVQQGAAATGNVLTNDSDPDGDGLAVGAVTGGTVGTLFHGTYGDITVNSNGSYTYSAGATPTELANLAAAAAGSHPTETITYTATDGHGGTSVNTLTITVDRLPTLTADANTASQGGAAATGNVLTNDSDKDGDTLTVSAVTGGAVGSVIHGTYGDLTLNADGSYSYAAAATPTELTALLNAPAGHQTEAFTYTTSDGHGGTATSTLTITLNRAPITAPDSNTAVQGGAAATGNVLTNDTDKDGDGLIVGGVTGGSVGTLFHGTYGDITINSNGSYTYSAGATPTELTNLAAAASGSHPTEVITYTAGDGHGGTSTNTLTITIDRLPTAVADTNAASQGGPAATGNVLTNDSDKDGDGLTVTAVTGGAVGALIHGTYGDLTLNANGSYTYAAAATPTELSNLLAAPAGHQTEAFTYTESDGHGGTTTSTLTLTLNRAPITAPDTNTAVQQGPAATGNVLSNDTDKDNDGVIVGGVVGGAVGVLKHGTYGDITINADGSYTYSAGATPTELANLAAAAAGSHPVEVVSYIAGDGHGGSSTNTLSITIDRLPTGVAETAEVLSGGTITRTAGTAGTGALAGDADRDGDTLTITGLTGGAVGVAKTGTYGSLTLNADGSYSYVANNAAAINAAPAGTTPTDVFTYSIGDGHGGTISETLSVAIDRAPIISGAVSGQSDDDQHTIKPFSTVTVTEPNNPSKVETVKVTLDNAAKGTFTAASLTASGFVANGGVPGEYDFTGTAAAVTAALHQLVFQPTPNDVPPGQTETTTFTIAVNDGISPTVTNSATTVNTLSINDPPVALAQHAFVEEQHTITGSVLTGDYDVDKGDSFHLTGAGVGSSTANTVGARGLVLHGTYGTLTLNANGTYSYSESVCGLATGQTYTDTFSYKITDTHGASSSNTLTITITDNNTGGGGGGGGGGSTTVMGGTNGHYLVGGAGATTFEYASASVSTTANPDLIANFNPQKGDIIDLSHLDAIPSTVALDHFTFVSSFDGHAGELILQSPDASGYWHLYGDTTGSGHADFEIAFHLIGQMNVTHIHLTP